MEQVIPLFVNGNLILRSAESFWAYFWIKLICFVNSAPGAPEYFFENITQVQLIEPVCVTLCWPNARVFVPVYRPILLTAQFETEPHFCIFRINSSVVNGHQLDIPPYVGPLASQRILILHNDNGEGTVQFAKEANNMIGKLLSLKKAQFTSVLFINLSYFNVSKQA